MQDESTEVYVSALNLLTRREHSRHELRRKLLSRYPNRQEVVDEVLVRLERESYQSDERFAEAYVRSWGAKGKGVQRLRQELRARGIEESLIEQVLSPLSDADAAMKRILLVWQKKFAQPPRDIQEKHRQMRFLLYRGFRQEEVERLFLHLRENPSAPREEGIQPVTTIE